MAVQRDLPMPKYKPKHVGTWVAACTKEGELIRWGKDGDTVFPYPPDDKEAKKQAKYVANSKIHREDSIYIIHVFDNGQMKQFSFEA